MKHEHTEQHDTRRMSKIEDNITRAVIQEQAPLAVFNARQWKMATLIPIHGRNYSVRPSLIHPSGWVAVPYQFDMARRRPWWRRALTALGKHLSPGKVEW